jgi:hypothetical protein
MRASERITLSFVIRHRCDVAPERTHSETGFHPPDHCTDGRAEQISRRRQTTSASQTAGPRRSGSVPLRRGVRLRRTGGPRGSLDSPSSRESTPRWAVPAHCNKCSTSRLPARIGSMGALDAPRTVSVRAVGRQVNVLRLLSAAGSCNSPSSARRQFEACTKPVPIGPRHHPHIASGRRAHRRFRCVPSRVSQHRRIRRCLSILSHRDCGASATQNSLHHGTPRAAVTPLLGLARIRPHLSIKACAFKPADMHVPPEAPTFASSQSPSFTHGNTSVYAYRALTHWRAHP